MVKLSFEMLCSWRGVHCPARTIIVPAAAHHVRLEPLPAEGGEEAGEVVGVDHVVVVQARSQVLLLSERGRARLV